MRSISPNFFCLESLYCAMFIFISSEGFFLYCVKFSFYLERKIFFTNIVLIDSNPNKKGSEFENKFTCILQEIPTFCAFKNSEGIPISSRRHTEPKTEHIFYSHNHFTTITKLLAIDVVKNMIHDK